MLDCQNIILLYIIHITYRFSLTVLRDCLVGRVFECSLRSQFRNNEMAVCKKDIVMKKQRIT